MNYVDEFLTRAREIQPNKYRVPKSNAILEIDADAGLLDEFAHAWKTKERIKLLSRWYVVFAYWSPRHPFDLRYGQKITFYLGEVNEPTNT